MHVQGTVQYQQLSVPDGFSILRVTVVISYIPERLFQVGILSEHGFRSGLFSAVFTMKVGYLKYD